MTIETHYATGRRKTSSARIYLSPGKGNIKVNDRDLDVYFGRKVAQMLVMQPLEMTENRKNNWNNTFDSIYFKLFDLETTNDKKIVKSYENVYIILKILTTVICIIIIIIIIKFIN